MNARVEALEFRLKSLEARVRETAPAKRPKLPSPPKAAHPGQPRCPGCTLLLPKGRRGDACVWCGFRFDAVRLLRAAGEKAR